MANDHAESLAMLFDEEGIVKIFSSGFYENITTGELLRYQNLTGKQFCEIVEKGDLLVPFTIDPVFNPFSQMNGELTKPSVVKELAYFWHQHSEETEKTSQEEQVKENFFIKFLEEIVRKIGTVSYQKAPAFGHEDNTSMANEVFLHPALCHIKDKKGSIKLHRNVTTEKELHGDAMMCSAEFVEYYNGEEFIDCPFDGDDVEIPLECFSFTCYGNCLIGKQLLQFKAELDSMAEIVVVVYPI